MRPVLAAPVLAAIAFWLVAAAPAGTGSYLRADDYRVASIGFRVATRAAALCPEPAPLSGAQLHHLADYEPKDQAGLVEDLGLDRGPGVLSVVGDSPAAEVGLSAGDVLLAINGLPLQLSPAESARLNKERPRGAREAIEARLLEQLRLGPADLHVLRAGREFKVRLAPRLGCPANVRLARSPEARAATVRGQIVLTTALLGDVADDDELAIIIGHELAHLVLRHAERLDEQGVPRGLLREFGVNAERVYRTEEEADRLALRLAWNAGYDAGAAIPLWRRLLAKYDGPSLFRTHPSLRARERLARQTIAELQAGSKRPEFREGPLRQR
ncbi:MAG TPA: M48 family metallopeptidase [Allosphingosinicella sp.]|jgi:hypothetical protein|uniref:M48 family metalloprotease n=1 Tax=Allosphingosinicella sp. TaxID=2823234 RepID=UPI002F27B150